MKKGSRSAGDSHLAAVVTAVVVIATLYFAKVVFIPLTLALLLSFLLTPVVSALERIKLPRGLAILVVVASLCGLLSLLGWKTYQQVINLTIQIPMYKTALVDKIHAVKGESALELAKASETVKALENEISLPRPAASAVPRNKPSVPAGNSQPLPVPVEVVPPSNLVDSLQNFLGPLATAGIILVFTIFMLHDRERLRDRFIRIVGGGRMTSTTQALEEASRRINRYLLLQMLVNACYGTIIGIALYFIGIPNAALWGVAAALLRFLPYAGPPMAAAMPVFLSLAIFNGWRHAIETAALFFTLEVLVSNFIEPLLYGAHVGLSALAILIAAIFWTMIWGVPGLLLSTPLTVFLVVMGQYLPGLSILNLLLGDEPVLSSSVQFYQRLLAADHNEARSVLDEYLKQKSLEDLYSDVVIPALRLAERDRYREDLDSDTQALMYQSIREMAEDLGESFGTPSPHGEQDTGNDGRSHKLAERADFVCLPARCGADDVVAFLLAQLLERQNLSARLISHAPIEEMVATVCAARARVACISALPSFSISHARELYRRLRRSSPELKILLCLWHLGGDLEKISARLKTAKGDLVLSTLKQVLEFAKEEETAKDRALISDNSPAGR